MCSISSDFRDTRILIYTTCYNVIDGVTITIRKLEQEILKSGGHVCILTTKSGNPANTNIVGAHKNRSVIFLEKAIRNIFYFDPDNPDLSYYIGFSLSEKDVKGVESFRPDIIHLTCPDSTSLHLINYARKRQLPLMGTYHSNIADYFLHIPGCAFLKPIFENYFRHGYNFYQSLYVPTAFIKRNLSNQLNMDKVTELKVWGRGVDLEKFNPSKRSSKFRRKYGIPEDIPVVLFVGRLVAEKSPGIYANVVRRLNNKKIRFHALVVGAGFCVNLFNGFSNCTTTGWLDGHELAEAYASSDIFLFPSSVETFGNVTLEAAASGLPLVVEKGCSGHLVENGKNGFACTAMDEDAFYDGTLRLLEDSTLRKLFSEYSIAMSKTMGKSIIVREMLKNYQDNIYDFHNKFGGLHENRDEMYNNKYSFIAGVNPRPIMVSLFEYSFIATIASISYLFDVMKKSKENIRNCQTASVNHRYEQIKLNPSVASKSFIFSHLATCLYSIGDSRCAIFLGWCVIMSVFLTSRSLNNMANTLSFCWKKVKVAHHKVDACLKKKNTIDSSME